MKTSEKIGKMKENNRIVELLALEISKSKTKEVFKFVKSFYKKIIK